MYDVNYNYVPTNNSNLFTRTKDIHNHHTRSSSSDNNLLLQVFTSRKTPFQMLAYVYGTRHLLILEGLNGGGGVAITSNG